MRTNCAHARCTSSLPLYYLCSKSTRGDFFFLAMGFVRFTPTARRPASPARWASV